MVSETAVREALTRVMDPHMNVSLPDMGMVRRVDIDAEGCVDVGLVFPCVGCPAWDLIQAELKQTVGEVAGVSRVKVKVAPFPSPSLSAHMVPPISSARRFEIARPSPVPPYLRVVELSA